MFELTTVEQARPAKVRGAKPFDQGRVEAAVRELLAAVGENPDRDGLRETPARVARMYREVFSGLREDPTRHLGRTFDEPFEEMVLLRDIDFAAVCEHHLLPFLGKVHVAYLPSQRVVGLSKLARLVEGYARRPQIQERLTGQVADALMECLGARGAMVVVESEHLCMKIRGVNKPNSVMVTSAVRGAFKDDAALRAEAMSLMTGRR